MFFVSLLLLYTTSRVQACEDELGELVLPGNKLTLTAETS